MHMAASFPVAREKAEVIAGQDWHSMLIRHQGYAILSIMVYISIGIGPDGETHQRCLSK